MSKDTETGRFHNPNPQYRVEDSGYLSPCWVWNWSVKQNIHGTYGRYKNTQAHRYYYTLHKGDIPSGYQVDHLCKNTLCVNPDHLEAVTPYVNTDRSRAAKVKDPDAEAIMRLYATGNYTQAEIGKMYGCNSRTISNLITGATKKHLDPLRKKLFN